MNQRPSTIKEGSTSNIIVLGCGKIGSVIARDLSGRVDWDQFHLADKYEESARAAASQIDGAEWMTLDTLDLRRLVKTLGEHDLVIGALPGDYGYKCLEAAVEAGVDILDVSFTPENPLELDEASKRAEITMIPDCGVAPGLSNILVGHASSKLDEVTSAHIMVGGIPERPVPPLGYTITWSAEGLIDEYVRDVNIIEDGKTVRKPALSGLEEIDFPGVGSLEAFYTDGLRTLSKSFPDVGSMWEKTLRYPGHVEKVKLLRELGFFDDEPVMVADAPVQPRLMTARLLERSLRMPNVGDLLAMSIEVKGVAGGAEKGYRFGVLDYYDHVNEVSAMARTTAYTASVVAGMLAEGRIREKGVVPPERLGMDENFAGRFLSELGMRGVEVKETAL